MTAFAIFFAKFFVSCILLNFIAYACYRISLR